MGAVQRIVVGVHGSLGSLQALRWAAEEARERHVPLVPVIAWVPPGGDLAERSHPSPYLRRLWQDAARARLAAAFEEALGGVPGDLPVQQRVERGDTGPVLVDVASQRTTCWSSALAAGGASRGCSTAPLAATAWPTRSARCWPSRRRR